MAIQVVPQITTTSPYNNAFISFLFSNHESPQYGAEMRVGFHRLAADLQNLALFSRGTGNGEQQFLD
jgi:hypothetical protein